MSKIVVPIRKKVVYSLSTSMIKIKHENTFNISMKTKGKRFNGQVNKLGLTNDVK